MRFKLSPRFVLLVWLALATLATSGYTAVSAQDSYPPPDPAAALPSEAPQVDEAYPAPESELPPPIEIEEIGAGQDSGPAGTTPDLFTMQVEAAQPTPSSSGAIFLWGSFLAALLLFATAVLGAIILFARRRDQ